MTTIPNPPYNAGDEFTNDITGVTYKYNGSSWIAISSEQDEAVEDLADNLTELTQRVAEGEGTQDTIIQTIDSALATQGELVNKVAQLEGVAIDARWTFEEDNRLPTRGEFALRGAGDAIISDWSAADVIIINPIDSLGNTYTFEKVSVGDVIRVGGPPGSSAEYKITEIGVQGSFRVEHLISEGIAQDEFMYAFTFLSSFDPQGLATIDYVDNQDGLRVRKTGDTMTGSLTISRGRNIEFVKEDDSNQFSIRPNINSSDYFTNIYSYNGSGVRFSVATGQTTEYYDTILSITGERHNIGDTEYRGKSYLNRVRTPTQDDHAVNKWYVDNAVGNVDLDGYLPLTGGDMTGDINMRNSRLDTFNADGDQTMEIAPSGFIKTRDMLRVVRTDGGPILEGRTQEDASGTTSKIWSNGDYEFWGQGQLYDSLNMRDGNRIIFRGNNNVNVGYIEAISSNQMTIAGYSGKTINIKNLNAPTAATDAATRGYVDGLVAPFVTGDEVDSKINNETVHLPLRGGTLTGGLGINISSTNVNGFAFSKSGNTNFTMKFQTADEARMIVQSGKVFKLNSYANGVQQNILSVGTGGNLGLYHLRTPTNPTDAATKGYVDEKLGQYGVPYKYRNTDTIAENLQPGEFFIAGDNSNAYFHPFDQLGRELVTTADQSHSTDVAGIFKVYDSTGKLVHQMAFNSYATGKASNNYCRLDKNHTMRTKSTWSSTETYYLADGFLLPY